MKRTIAFVSCSLLALAAGTSTVAAQGTNGVRGTQGTQETQGTKGSEGKNGESADAKQEPAEVKKTSTGTAELTGAIRNESARKFTEAFRYGAEGSRPVGKTKVEGIFELIHEAYQRVPIIDEARLAVSVPKGMFGREVQLGVTVWRDLTIDARSRVVGPELLVPGPLGIEFSGGAYIGNINIEESWGRFAMALAQAERVFDSGFELSVHIERGQIRSEGEPGPFGEGVFKKFEFEGIIPMTAIPGLRRIPGQIALSIEKKQTTFGSGGPDDREVTKIIGYEFSLPRLASKIGQAFHNVKP